MKSTYDQIWEAAIKKLEARAHSKQELLQKLSDKFPADRGLILKVLEEMERIYLLSDRRFAEEYIHYLIQKPVGRLKIMMETRKRGLDDDMVEQVLIDAGYSEEESARQAIEEKSRVLNETDERRNKQKIINFLRNRGFKDWVIFRLMKN